MKKILAISFFASMLCFLMTAWTAKYTIYAEAWTQSVCFFALTYYLLRQYEGSKVGTFPIVAMIILGRVILEMPIRIIDFYDSLFSIFVPIITMISVILAAVCFKEKRSSVFVLTIIILILLNTVTHEAWYHMIRP